MKAKMKVAVLAGFVALAACARSERTPDENAVDNFENVADSYGEPADTTIDDNAAIPPANVADMTSGMDDNGSGMDNDVAPSEPANAM